VMVMQCGKMWGLARIQGAHSIGCRTRPGCSPPVGLHDVMTPPPPSSPRQKSSPSLPGTAAAPVPLSLFLVARLTVKRALLRRLRLSGKEGIRAGRAVVGRIQ
jgi:hypothetical protein